MELNAAQIKLVENKSLGYNLLKGVTGSGKTTTAVYRSVYLENYYCLYDKDRILMIAGDSTQIEDIKRMYDKAKENTKFNYITLFSKLDDKLHIHSIEDIVYKYFRYDKKYSNYNLIESKEEKESILVQCIKEVKKSYEKLKILNNKYIEFIIDEISWIKSCNYNTLEKYQDADRIGRSNSKIQGPRRLMKNSDIRKAIFKIMTLYNEKLEEKKLIDLEDMALIALQQCKNIVDERYTHVIVDESQNLTRVQLELVREINSNETYSSTTYVLSKDNCKNSNGWLIKSRKTSSLGLPSKVKGHIFTKKYENYVEKKRIEYSMESFKYCDIKHGRDYELSRDINNISEIIVKDSDSQYKYSEEELKKLPVYSDIAAGEPILMNPEIEDVFYVPTYWLKGMKDCFILKVRGDSMIGADIDNGDYVIIKKQYTAQNKDIVAVNLDGNATLKRFVNKKEGIYLMPENKKYEPIRINDEGARIIGVAVGIIKEN
ncbi:LexA family transcriptional regulator [Clostridium carboxidivorans P7]|uniref:LexA repressor n=1 Tax=Clostridium carboxidivorans P7 TaxID=536227 RepID=C6Q0C8_9CLOT|nr:transcriptional repressor LexA [Clostridium carboxidivorans]AKN29507.1 LexA family transcriptional regulator [Clostridium carboxidivorans P7]EET85055.1 LexA repressor [Clostridium carboxidivorans P7]EFG89570.1 repressor LexA [Clostridium carboxidivorans P7]